MKKINSNIASNDSIYASRAYTFMDSYIYAKNRNYNALYEKNKDILQTERRGIESRDTSILYDAATEQTQALMSLIIRIRDFSLSIYDDVVSNIETLIPNYVELNDFSDAINSGYFTKEKILQYDIKTIEYPDVSMFFSLFDSEVGAFTNIDYNSNKNAPMIRNRATRFLLDNIAKNANDNNSTLSSETLRLATIEDAARIKAISTHKSGIIGVVSRDFRTYYYFLKQFKMLQKMLDAIYPMTTNTGEIVIGKVTKRTIPSFNDYLVLYKHYTMIIKCLMDIVSYYDTKFFNKIYAIQSNIELNTSFINHIVSNYRTKMRNVNESFDAAAPLISGVEPAIQFHQESGGNEDDEIEYAKTLIPVDRVGGNEIMFSDSDEPVYPSETDVNKFKDSIPDDYDGEIEQISGEEIPNNTYYSNSMFDIASMERDYQDINSLYSKCHPSDLIFNKTETLREAADSKAELQNTINGIVADINRSTNLFVNSAGDILKNNGISNFIEVNKDISKYDLSGIEFDMYRYPKGKEIIDTIKIPKFSVKDIQILLASDGLAYKEKYFPDLFYFSQIGAPLNVNKFRGSISKKKIEQENMNDAYIWFVDYINNYGKIINTVIESNKRVEACFDLLKKQNDKAYGSNDDIVATESIMLGRTEFRNELFDVFLEEDMNIPEEQQNPEQEPQQPESSKEELNINPEISNEANISEETLRALAQYCKIVFSVASCKMDVYEEILTTAFDFIKTIMNSVN